MRKLLYTNPNGLTLELGGPDYPITKLEGIDVPGWDDIETMPHGELDALLERLRR